MATQGIFTLYLGKLDQNTGQLLKGTEGLSESGIYEADGHQNATAEGATQIQISNLGTAPTLQYSNNKAKRATKTRSYPTAEFTMLDLGFEVKQKILGKVQTTSKGFVDGEKDAHIAAIAVTQTLDKQHYVYYAFANGTMIEGNKTMGTNTNAETDSNDVMTLTTMNPIIDGQFGGEPYQVGSDLIDGFSLDSLMTETFPGYTKPVAVSEISLDKPTNTLTVGGSATAVATIAPADATDKSVVWKSSDTTIVTVDGNGKYTGVKSGTADVTVTTNDGAKSAKVTVTVDA